MEFFENKNYTQEKNSETPKSILDPKFIKIIRKKLADELEDLFTSPDSFFNEEELNLPDKIRSGEKIRLTGSYILDKFARIVIDGNIKFEFDDLEKLYEHFFTNWREIININGFN